MFPLNKTVRYEQKLRISEHPHRFSACILISPAHCLSPTYSLLCSHSCGAVWLFQEADKLLYLTQLQWQVWWQRDGWHCVSWFNGCSSAGADAGPLACSYGGCSSTQHPHAAHWPPHSSWTSSENNFAKAAYNASKSPQNLYETPVGPHTKHEKYFILVCATIPYNRWILLYACIITKIIKQYK